MTAGVSDRRDQDPLAANEIGDVKWESRKVNASKPARTLSPKKRLSGDNGADTHEFRPEASTQARNALFVISRGFLDLGHRLWQELQHLLTIPVQSGASGRKPL